MPEGELLNHFQCDIQCMTSNSGNDNTNIKIIIYNGKLIGDADANADADAEVPMLRFPNGPLYCH